MPRFATVLLLLLFIAPTARAQVVVTGTIRDGATGESLPAATIEVAGAGRGTISNTDGRFALRIEQVPAELIVRFIGYETARRTVTTAAALDIQLTPSAFELPELVVGSEDPGIEILRRVIERKQRWRATLDTYRAEAYTRFVLRNDTGIVSIIESLSDAFWDRKRGLREVVKARRLTANMKLDDLLPAAGEVLNLYDDDIEINDAHLVGPTHPKALSTYTVTLAGRRSLDGRTVFDLDLTPKSKLATAFVGRISILDGVFAMIAADLRPSAALLYPPPINAFDAEYHQQFRDADGDTTGAYLPVDFRFTASVDIGLPGLTIPTIHLDQISRLTAYTLNVPLPDSLYKPGAAHLVADSASLKRGGLLAVAGATVPLSAAEQTALASIDSTQTLERAFKPRGALARFIDVRDDDNSPRRTGKPRPFGLGIKPDVWANRVDGYHLGARPSLTVKRVKLTGLAAYNTSRERGDYGGSASFRSKRGVASLEFRTGSERTGSASFYSPLFVSPLVLVGAADYFNYGHDERWTSDVSRPFARLRTTATLGLTRETWRSLGQTKKLGPSDQRPNPPVDDGRIGAVRFETATVFDGSTGLVSGARQITLRFERGASGLLGGDFDFTKLEGAVDWRFETLFRRRFLPNALDLRLVGQLSGGYLPRQRFALLDGALGPATPFGTFHSRRLNPVEGEQSVALFWEHHFRTIPFELLGLRGLAKRGYGITLGGASGRTWINPNRLKALNLAGPVAYDDHVRHELTLSLNGLFGLARLDLTRRLDRPGTTVGVSVSRLF